MWRHVTMVTKCLDLNHFSWEKRPFASFLCAFMDRKVIPVTFFSAAVYLQDHGFLRFRNFAAMATWRNDFSLFCSPPQIATPLPWSSAQHCLKLVPMWTVPMASSVRLFTTLWTAPRVASRQLLMWKIYWSSMEQTRPSWIYIEGFPSITPLWKWTAGKLDKVKPG